MSQSYVTEKYLPLAKGTYMYQIIERIAGPRRVFLSSGNGTAGGTIQQPVLGCLVGFFVRTPTTATLEEPDGGARVFADAEWHWF